MDDDVRMLTVKCAEALGYSMSRAGYQPYGQVWVTKLDDPQALPSAFLYAPASDPSQAFELLCWLAERGSISMCENRFTFVPHKPAPATYENCSTPAELRLALMRATVKVHEGRGK